MAGLAAFHAAFAAAAVSGDISSLAPFVRTGEGEGGMRVYCNNVAQAIVAALASNYPAVRRLVGDDYFTAAAVGYCSSAPPRVRTLVAYGETFPAHLDGLSSAAAVPYIGDVARLDRAWLEAHIGPDAPALDAHDLRGLSANSLERAKIALHPSVRCVRTRWSVYSAWAANRAEGLDSEIDRIVAREPQSVLLWRIENEVVHRLLEESEVAFVSALADGAALGVAAEAAIAAAPDADVSAIFAAALSSGLLAHQNREAGNDE